MSSKLTCLPGALFQHLAYIVDCNDTMHLPSYGRAVMDVVSQNQGDLGGTSETSTFVLDRQRWEH
jgi:hypothetical protein